MRRCGGDGNGDGYDDDGDDKQWDVVALALTSDPCLRWDQLTDPCQEPTINTINAAYNFKHHDRKSLPS